MDRNILFRGKDVKTGKWYFGFYYKTLGKHYILGWTEPDSDSQQLREVIPETVGQFTGLSDKNGVKIFEGDILRANSDVTSPDENEIYKVDWNNKTAQFAFYYLYKGKNVIVDGFEFFDGFWDIENGFEIIGNIHDNPELLEDVK